MANNSTILLGNEHDDSAYIGWILLPVFLGTMIYCSAVLFTWPYARPVVPFWLLLLCILVPVLFPFLFLYILIIVCLPLPRRDHPRPVIVVVEPSTRGRVVAVSRPRTITNGNRV